MFCGRNLYLTIGQKVTAISPDGNFVAVAGSRDVSYRCLVMLQTCSLRPSFLFSHTPAFHKLPNRFGLKRAKFTMRPFLQQRSGLSKLKSYINLTIPLLLAGHRDYCEPARV